MLFEAKHNREKYKILLVVKKKKILAQSEILIVRTLGQIFQAGENFFRLTQISVSQN